LSFGFFSFGKDGRNINDGRAHSRLKIIFAALPLMLFLCGCGVGKFGRDFAAPFSPAAQLAQAEEEIRNAENDYWRLFWLGKAGMACVDFGRLEEAKNGKVPDFGANLSY